MSALSPPPKQYSHRKVPGGNGGREGGDGGEGGGGEGGGEGGEGGCEGGGEGGEGGTGHAVWQTYFREVPQLPSFHRPGAQYAPPPVLRLNSKQSSLPELLGSPECQLVYDSGVLDGLHTHAPSDAASVPPIHAYDVPAAAVTSSAFCAADCTLANWRPAA